MKKLIIGLVIALTAIIVSCSITKKNDLDKDVKFVLEHFQTALSKSDDELFKIFRSSQKKDGLIKALRILQNRDSLVNVSIQFSNATSSKEDQYFVIELPVEFNGKGEATEKSKFSMKIFRKEHTLYIAHLDAEDLYTQFNYLKSRIAYGKEMAKASAETKLFYDRMIMLQTNFDSVVWYTTFKETKFYYAVNGEYIFDSLNAKSPNKMKMGLLSEDGKIILPVEFDLIGNPGMTLPDLVEVKKGGKIGYYSMIGEEIIPTKYEWLIPYNKGEAKAIVKTDSSYGWLDRAYQFHDDFPSSKAESYIRDFEFLTQNKLTLGSGHQELILSPKRNFDQNYVSEGIIVTPAYLVKFGLFVPVLGQFLSTKEGIFEFEFGNSFMENSTEKPFSISLTMDILISHFKTRYLGGRNEFYVDHRINILDKKQNLISSISTWGESEFKFRKINDSLFESSSINDYNGPDDVKESNFPFYNYFNFDGNNLSELKSSRRFRFTEFIKMDSSYLTGNFITYEYSGKGDSKEIRSTFASKESIEFIQDEILVSYGFVFPDSSKQERFSHYLKDKTAIQTYEEVYGMASEIDKYNLDFLNKIVGPVVMPI